VQAGQRVRVGIAQILSSHAGIRFDGSQRSAANNFARRAASREVKALSPDRSEALVELYWNGALSAAPGIGHVWRTRVKRLFFGQFFD
jgi:hypothetical protein